MYVCVYIYIYIYIHMYVTIRITIHITMTISLSLYIYIYINMTITITNVSRNHNTAMIRQLHMYYCDISFISLTLSWITYTMGRHVYFGWHYLSNATCQIQASFVVCVFRRVNDHHNLLHASPLSKKTCVGRVVLDKWSPLKVYYTRSPLEDSRLFGTSPWKILRHYL